MGWYYEGQNTKQKPKKNGLNVKKIANTIGLNIKTVATKTSDYLKSEDFKQKSKTVSVAAAKFGDALMDAGVNAAKSFEDEPTYTKRSKRKSRSVNLDFDVW